MARKANIRDRSGVGGDERRRNGAHIRRGADAALKSVCARTGPTNIANPVHERDEQTCTPRTTRRIADRHTGVDAAAAHEDGLSAGRGRAQRADTRIAVVADAQRIAIYVVGWREIRRNRNRK